MQFDRESVRVNDIKFEVIRAGEGSRMLLFLHGFPDYAGSMKDLMSQFDPESFTLVAPFMRGYAPTDSSSDNRYQVKDLASDALSLIENYGRDASWIVGHDWGAAAAYASAVMGPEKLEGITAMSVPPMQVLVQNLPANPDQFLRSWYMFFFQLPILPEGVIGLNDYTLIDWFWRNWSPGCNYDPAEVEAVKEVFATGDTTSNALRYYRSMFWDLVIRPIQHNRNRKILFSEIDKTTLVLAGEQDGCVAPELFENTESVVNDRSRFEVLPDAGHFLPQECPSMVADRVKQFFFNA